MLEVGSWQPAFCYQHMEPNDVDFDATLSAVNDDAGEDDERDRKRQRRSIFFVPDDSDSDDEPEDVPLCQATGSLDCLQPQCQLVPATPYVASALSKGTCILSPSFTGHSTPPCLSSACSFVAVHEEPNAGYRNYMEDRSAAMTSGGVAYLGVYDGHGGIDASTFLQQHLLPNIRSHLRPGADLHEALTLAYSATNAAFRATGSIQGSTATTVILERRRLIAANVGDSPAFVVKKSGEVYSVIQEHKIEGEEAARIAAHGAPIYRSATGPAYMGTPDGTRWLNMSRAFGDFVYPAISCEPYVCSLDVSDGKYLVIGSDGLTEKWSVTEAAQYLTQMAAGGASLEIMCRGLVERSLARGSTDNISCMVVDLEAYMRHADASAPTQIGAAAAAAAAASVGIEAASSGVVPPSPMSQEQQLPQPQQQPQQPDPELEELVCKETPIEEQQRRSPCRQLARASPVPLGSALASAAAGALSAGARASVASPCVAASPAAPAASPGKRSRPEGGEASGSPRGFAGAGVAVSPVSPDDGGAGRRDGAAVPAAEPAPQL